MSTWAENRRADQAARAERERADKAMLFEQRRADEAARAERKRADKAAAAELARAARDAARDRRVKTAKAAVGWVSAHTVDLLFVPVIFVPALLAWSAIAGFGHELYGAPGWTMPLYSEAAMWAFAFALATARRTGRPVRRLLIGLWFSAAVSATLAFLHGLTADGGTVTDGVVMAIVAIGGVVVHQLVDTATTAPPRRTREQRAADRLQRLAAKRVHEVRRAALRQAAAELAADGTVTLVHRPGLVELRRRFGRVRLVPTTVAGLPVTTDGDGGIGDALAAEIGEYLTALPALPAPRAARTASTAAPTPADRPDTTPTTGAPSRAHRSGNAETPAAPDAAKIARYIGRTRAAIDGGRLPERPSQTEVRKFLRCRSEDAAAVHRALFPSRNDGPDEGDTRQAVTA
ncbi:hypothetical protein JOF41_006381 [Saccharothrix coeruleofusca]|uniref:hypothetical protein n=1 Tax=Saccharothrix coeruleofusca TaxID=33919 RepID=UPI001AEB9147|nr:hypothetical protein [Saccharothrix coeruleofusca]MBP2340203.1 hypothetical protein [Saccharothrix coeruleofusca]